ncbi:MAG TPA: hypothetical protein VLA98_10840 [Solirubrobacteraceae bacterium]|nr:hypothetical protein [Solirubrobacteraceae bacterium]
MPLAEGPHKQALLEALELEADGQRLLLAGDEAAAGALQRAVARYRASWELAPPASYGRLIGMLKAAVLAGGGEDEARYARAAVEDDGGASPPRAYALALAALVLGDDAAATAHAEGMRPGGDAFGRAADGIAAVAAGDADALGTTLAAIVADFEGRSDHLTGVPIADTALMLDRLWTRRGNASALPASPLLPGH